MCDLYAEDTTAQGNVNFIAQSSYSDFIDAWNQLDNNIMDTSVMSKSPQLEQHLTPIAQDCFELNTPTQTSKSVSTYVRSDGPETILNSGDIKPQPRFIRRPYTYKKRSTDCISPELSDSKVSKTYSNYSRSQRIPFLANPIVNDIGALSAQVYPPTPFQSWRYKTESSSGNVDKTSAESTRNSRDLSPLDTSAKPVYEGLNLSSFTELELNDGELPIFSREAQRPELRRSHSGKVPSLRRDRLGRSQWRLEPVDQPMTPMDIGHYCQCPSAHLHERWACDNQSYQPKLLSPSSLRGSPSTPLYSTEEPPSMKDCLYTFGRLPSQGISPPLPIEALPSTKDANAKNKDVEFNDCKAASIKEELIGKTQDSSTREEEIFDFAQYGLSQEQVARFKGIFEKQLECLYRAVTEEFNRKYSTVQIGIELVLDRLHRMNDSEFELS